MATYAVYRIWVGLSRKQYENIENNDFLDKVFKSFDPVEISGLKFQNIYMRRETVGVGVIVEELNWTSEIAESNVYDIEITDRALRIATQVYVLLISLGIFAEAKIYHHIDLTL